MRYSDDPQPEAPDAPEYEGLGDDVYKSRWREWLDLYGDARRQNCRDQEYYDGDVYGTGEGQWTSKQLETLRSRNQPPTVFNVVALKVNAVSGVEQRSRTEARAQPRTPKDQYAAEIATDALRYIGERTQWSKIKAEAFLDGITIGYAAVDIGGSDDTVPVTPIRWREFAFDPRSRRSDFSDARWLAVAKWVDKDTALETYAPEVPQPEIPPQPQTGDPYALMQWQAQAQQVIAQYQKDMQRQQEIAERIDATANGSGSGVLSDEIDDDEMPAGFCDSKRQRIFVVDMWHRDAKRGWYRCVFTGAGKLFTEAATLVENDRWGKPQKVSPIKAFSLFVSAKGWRYGIVRGMRSPQDEYNARRSKAMHFLAVNQIITKPGNYGPDGDKESLRREATRADGVIEVSDPGNFRIEKNIDLAASQQRLGQEAREFLEGQGANLELQGQPSGAKSGRAILAMQQAGLGQLGPVFDRFHEWEDSCYRAQWHRVQQFWTAPMYVRVTDDKNAARFAAVNGAPVLDENGQPKVRAQQPGMGTMPGNGNPSMGGAPSMMQGMAPPQPAMQGAMQGPQGPMMGHNGGPELTPQDMGETGPMLAELDMDIIVDRANESATLQAEQFEELVKLASAGMLGPPAPEMARMLVTASALPTKSQLLDMLDKMGSQPKGPSPQEKALLQKLAAEIEKLVAERDKLKAETTRTQAQVPETIARAAKTGAEARIGNTTATITELQAGFPAGGFQPTPSFQSAGPAPPTPGPMAAASPPGAFGLPPTQANGPPPY